MDDQSAPTKKNMTIYVVMATLLVFSILYIVYRGKTIQTKTPANSELKLINISEISIHNTKDSCWTTINGGVYDVTKFISQHKGGDRILAACGVDATALFTGTSSLGRVHSVIAVKFLESMKIGDLQQ